MYVTQESGQFFGLWDPMYESRLFLSCGFIFFYTYGCILQYVQSPTPTTSLSSSLFHNNLAYLDEVINQPFDGFFCG